jgi:hypothetical protein
MEKAFDICIIGAGASGLTVAASLLKKNKKISIALFEKSAEDEEVITGKEFGLPITHVSGIGGTTSLWGGACIPFDDVDFKSWPISKKEMRSYYSEALRMLGLEDISFYENFLKNTEIVSQIDQIFKNKSFFDQGIQPRIVQQLLPAPNFAHLFKDVLTDPRVKVLKECKVLTLDGNSGKVSSVTYRDKLNKEQVLKASSFILCAGALDSPAILLNSIKQETIKGFSNPNIGKFLSDHPMGFLAQIKLPEKIVASYLHRYKQTQTIRHKIGFGFKLESDEQYNNNFYLIPSFKEGSPLVTENVKKSLLTIKKKALTFGDIWVLIKNPQVIFQVFSYLFRDNPKVSLFDIWFIGEQKPSNNSFIDTLSIAGCKDYKKIINWEVSEADIKSYLKEINKFLSILESNDIKTTFKPTIQELRRYLTSAAHHMSTCRMSNTDSDGVVDCNLKVYGLENVFICDASVIPKSGHANPTLTLMALAIRFCDNVDF